MARGTRRIRARWQDAAGMYDAQLWTWHGQDGGWWYAGVCCGCEAREDVEAYAAAMHAEIEWH